MVVGHQIGQVALGCLFGNLILLFQIHATQQHAPANLVQDPLLAFVEVASPWFGFASVFRARCIANADRVAQVVYLFVMHDDVFWAALDADLAEPGRDVAA